MISKEDAINFFNKMMKFEEKMESIYKELSGQVKLKEYRDYFFKMMNEEIEHKGYVSEIIKLLERWPEQ